MQIGEYTLVNEDKAQRVIEGTTNAKGEFLAGLGEEAIEKNAAAVLAGYDKLGGLITGKDGARVKTGSFYDFKAKAARKTPEVIYTFRINGEYVEMKEGESEPLEVQAAKLAERVKAKKVKKK